MPPGPGSWPDVEPASSMTPDQKKSNLRLALILGAIAVAVFVGFIVKSALYGV